jgi:hypothetical protein
MIQRTALVIAFLFCTTALAPSAAPKARIAQETGAAKDVQSDLERMHALLSQMQKNAAFVSQGYTPMKHQFELEIEMWQLLLQDLDNKVSGQASR